MVETYDTDNVSGKIGLDYTGIEDTLLYASVSRGFKSGGFQGQLSFDPAALQPFGDEEVLAYEVGMKSRLAGNSLEFNASVFFYDYEDMQFYGGLFDSPVGVLFGIANIGDAEIKGAEADIWWRPTEGLDLRFGLGYLDTEITNSVVDGVATGSELPNSPEFTFSSMARYEWAISGTLTAEVAVAARLPGQRHLRHRPGAAAGDRGQLLALRRAHRRRGGGRPLERLALGQEPGRRGIPHAGHQLERRLRRDLGHAADLRPDVHDADVIGGDVHFCLGQK